MMKFLAVLACFAAVAVASDRVNMFTSEGVPSDWKISGFAGAEAQTEQRFLFALKQRNLDLLDAKFWAVSDPTNKEYTQYLSKDEILSMVAPSTADHNKVISWLQSHGVTQIKSFGDAIEAFTTTAVAQKLFDTDFHKLAHEDGREIVRSVAGYSLPKSIAQVVDFVTGVCSFPIDHPQLKKTAAASGLSVVVPQTLRQLYDIPAGTKVQSANLSQTVVEFQSGQSFMPSDLATFATNVAADIAPLTNDHIIGNFQPSQPGDECSLDIEYIAAMGQGAVNWWWQDNYWVYDWATTFFGHNEVPLVASVSYGWAEDDQCQFGQCSKLGVNSQQYVQRTNVEFQKIGLRGVSIMIASGDSGANGRSDPYCSAKQLKPTFPGASPFVTAVGATEVKSSTQQFNLPNAPPACNEFSCISAGTEQAVSFDQSHFASGGGFSNVASRPAYQNAAVEQFLSNTGAHPADSYFNKNGRGYPDVAALGSSIYIEYGGQQTTVGGTSASTPEWAGIVTLLNDARMQAGKNSLGFLNQMLYQAPAAAFNDVTAGNNKCTENGCGLFGSCKGFDAVAGWDPVTGLGSPSFQKLKEYVLSLP